MEARRPGFEQRAHRRAFGDQVRRQRIERGWTQEQFAERADLHRSYVAGIESGSRNPTLDVIMQIARALRVDPGQLFS